MIFRTQYLVVLLLEYFTVSYAFYAMNKRVAVITICIKLCFSKLVAIVCSFFHMMELGVINVINTTVNKKMTLLLIESIYIQ